MAALQRRASSMTRVTCSRVTNGRTASCTRDEFDIVGNKLQRFGDGALAGVRALDDADRLLEVFLADPGFQFFDDVGARSDDDLGDQRAGGDAAEA